MIRKETLHFSVGDGIGIMVQNIAYEHLFCNMDPQKALDTITGCGCPEQYALQILKQELFLTGNGPSMMAICHKEELPKGHYSQYHKNQRDFMNMKIHKGVVDLIEQGEYFTKHVYQFFSKGLVYTINIDNAECVFNMPRGWNWKAHTTMSPFDIANIWVHNDVKMKTILENAEITRCFSQAVSDIFQELESMRQYVIEGNKLIKLGYWLKENDMGEIPEDFIRYERMVSDISQLMTILHELDKSMIDTWLASHKSTVEDNSVVDRGILDKVSGSNLDRFIAAQRKSMMRDLTEPVKWDHNWTAGFIDREGHIYAMDDVESRLAHIDIADAWYEKYPDTPCMDNNRDWSLDRLGWIRFHDGRIRFSGYNIVECGHGMRDLPFTSRQKDRLAEYCKKFYPSGIYNEGIGDAHTMITEKCWNEWDDEQFRKIFEI